MENEPKDIEALLRIIIVHSEEIDRKLSDKDFEQIYKKFREHGVPVTKGDDYSYQAFQKIIKKYDYTLKDVEYFVSKFLPSKEQQGSIQDLEMLLAAAMINRIISEEDEIEITNNFSEPIPNVGYRLSCGKIHVKGDAFTAGYGMSDGELIIDGDVEIVGNEMSGGLIHVKGNVLGPFNCDNMNGGRVIIDGNVEDVIASGMKDGVIEINGNYKIIDDLKTGGEIYHRGRKIWG